MAEWLGLGSDHHAFALDRARVLRLPRWPGGERRCAARPGCWRG
ncbi:hypothetical protein [Deinococcus aquaticus]